MCSHLGITGLPVIIIAIMDFQKKERSLWLGLGNYVLYPQKLLMGEGKDGEWSQLLQRVYPGHLLSMAFFRENCFKFPINLTRVRNPKFPYKSIWLVSHLLKKSVYSGALEPLTTLKDLFHPVEVKMTADIVIIQCLKKIICPFCSYLLST